MALSEEEKKRFNQKDIVKLNSDKYRNQVESGQRAPIDKTNTGQPVQVPLPQNTQKMAGSYVSQKPPEPVNPVLPNSEKLTPFEHWLYDRLPGFSQSSVGKALEWFSNTGVGKALTYLDVAAEGLERTIGLGVQLANKKPGDDFRLADAWYAGSLTADVTNLPVFTYGDNPEKGKLMNPAFSNQVEPDKIVTGFRIPTDLPGTENGLTQARQKITAYVNGGMSEHDALIRVRDEMYNGLGALALRSQLHDTYFHVFADPFNYFLPYLKPVEKIKAVRYIAETQKSLRTAEELRTAAKIAGNAKDLIEAEKLLAQAQKVESGAIKTWNTADKFAYFITGGDVLSPNKIDKIPVLNAFRLTPASKAQEIVGMVSDNVGQRFIASVYNNVDAEGDFMKLMDHAATSSTKEYGHAMTTLEGRTTQGFLSGSNVALKPMYAEYTAAREAGHMDLLQILSRALDQTPASLLRDGEKQSATIFRTLLKKSQTNPEIAGLIQRGVLNENTASDLSGIFAKGFKPFDKETFFIKAQILAADHAMRQAITQFGVEPTKFITRWSNALKSAESLAYMRLNPAYGLRNVINNEMTMLSRGVWGLMTPDEIGAFWKDVGFSPNRLMEGFSAGGEIESGANQVLKEALQAKRGAPEKIQDFFRSVNLGKVDMTAWSRGMESSASARATTLGYKQYWNEFYKPTPVERIIDTQSLDRLNQIQPELGKAIQGIFRDSNGSEAYIAKALGENLNLSVDSVLEATSHKLQLNVREMLGEEIVSHIEKGLPEAIKSGKVDDFVREVRQKIDAHIENLYKNNLEDIIGNTKNQVATGGHSVLADKTAETMDMFWGGQEEHALRQPELTQAIREADPKTAHSLWIQNKLDSEKYFNRLFGRVDAYLQGLEQGAKEAGIKFPSETRSAFKQFTENWKDFFTWKNTEQEAFFKARLDGKEYQLAWDDLQAQISKRYDEAALLEDQLQQSVDDAIGKLIQNPDAKQVYTKYRDTVALKRQAYKEYVREFYQKVNTVSGNRQDMYNEFAQIRSQMLAEIRVAEQAGINAMQGNPNALMYLQQSENALRDARRTMKAYGVQEKHGVNIVNKFLRGEYTGETIDNAQQITNLAELQGTDILKQSLRARLTAGEGSIPEGMKLEDFLRVVEEGQQTPVSAAQMNSYIADYKKVVPNLRPVDLATDSTAYGKQYSALDVLVSSAQEQARKEPLLIKNLPSDLKEKVLAYIEFEKSTLGDHRLAGVRFAEYRRDSALLNYNRRTNFDAFLGNIAPFSFWTTHSMYTWAIESIDRPAMLTTYMRSKKFLETAGKPEQGFPSRFRDNIRVKIPFMPDWMGEGFIDPLRLLLPFDAFTQPFEQAQQSGLRLDGTATRLLDDQLANGKITQTEYNEATQTHSGPVWDMAVSQAEENDANLKFDAFDFASLMSAPHAPLVWAYNAARGTPENIGPFSPVSRMVKNAATMLGVKDWNNSSYNLEARIRREMGLTSYDKWDTYRTDRMLSNMSMEGKYTIDEINRAMILNDQISQGLSIQEAKQSDVYDLYQEATYRANQESMGGTLGGVLGFFGLNVKGYPTGEKELRALQDDFSAAYKKYDKANEAIDRYMKARPEMSEKQVLAVFEKTNPSALEDANALQDFFDKHPEYETRLGLFDKPEERLRKMLIDQTWGAWNQLPKVNQDELKDQLGTPFAETFLNKETRSYESLTTNQMQAWIKLMGGKPVGTMSAEQNNLIDFFSGQLKLTKPEIAWRAQLFYDTRAQDYPDYYDVQQDYYDLPKNKRSQYKNEHPELQQYWDFRRKFMIDNPDLVPYLTDDEKAIEKAKKAARTQNAVLTSQELQAQGYTYQDWESMLPPGVADTLVEYSRNNREIPSYVIDAVERFSVDNGISRRDIMQSVVEAAGVK